MTVTYTSGNPSETYSVSHNGTDGTDGTDGYNQATIYLYQRSEIEPSAPSNLTYNFTNG